MSKITLDQFEHYDVSKLNHEQLHELIYEFYIAHQDITKWSLCNWRLSNNLKSLDYLFSFCYNLVDIDISGWNTEEIRTADNMFLACEDLKRVSMRNVSFDVLASSVHMFCNCEMLDMIITDWPIVKVLTRDAETFGGSTNINNIQFLVPKGDSFNSIVFTVDNSTHEITDPDVTTITHNYEQEIVSDAYDRCIDC